MRRYLISAAAAGTMLVGSGFVMAAHAADTPPPPTYTSPCGQSVETGPAPTSPTLIGIDPSNPQPPSGNGTIGVIGPDGYLELTGSAGAGGVSGHLGGATATNVAYGQIGNETGSPTICVGTSATGPVHAP